MLSYLGGLPVTLTIPLVGSEGESITPQSVSYRVIDQDEVELVAKVAFDGYFSGDAAVVITIPGELNALAVGVTRAMRVVELYLTTDVGTIKIEQGYLIEAEELLIEGQNSFQNYNKANLASFEIPNLPGWNNAEKKDRIAALIAARRNIGRLRFRYVFDAYQNIIDNTVGVSDLTSATPEQWAALPKSFRDSICRAQVIEADYLLGGDELGDLRRAGLMSMSVGEAKQFFRPAKQIEGPVCKRAMKEVSKFVLTRTRTTRS